MKLVRKNEMWDSAVDEAKKALGYSLHEYIEDWDSVVDEAKEIYAEWKREDLEEHGRDTNSEFFRNQHQKYLKSEQWQMVRKRALIRDGFICKDCNERANEVHHERYDPLGTPWEIHTVVSLCKECHEDRHGIKGGRKWVLNMKQGRKM